MLIIKSYIGNNPGVSGSDIFSTILVRTYYRSNNDYVAKSVDMTMDGAVYIAG
jgi:hypothetical protein